MNSNLQTLFNAAQKTERLAVGLMSGTSLDGLDIALCSFKGHGLHTTFKLLEFKTVSYDEHFKNEVKQIFSRRTVDLEKLCILNDYIGNFHGELINNALTGWKIKNSAIDFIASHGQTIYHAPKSLHKHAQYPNATLQIGDADHIAVKTGILTIADFRQKHLAAGGEGAPLALYGDYILGSNPNENRILLNIGGISNFTYLPAGGNGSGVMCSDIGPGNTLIDAACKKYFDCGYDHDGLIAFSGTINEALLQTLLAHPFFAEPFPKTTGPELFNLAYAEACKQHANVNNITPADMVATLSAFTAHAIQQAFLPYGTDYKLFISGGGANNPFIVQQLQLLQPHISIATTDAIGMPADAKEAVLFALLGNEALCGQPIAIGKNPAVLMGKFSFPL